MDLGSSFNTRIPSKPWISFTKSKMDHTSRNLWYRIIHKKMPDKITMHGMNLVDSERCAFCNQTEYTLHMLFMCDHKSDIWYKLFKILIENPQQIFLDRLYGDITNITLPRYTILSLDLKINIFELFSTALRIIWRAHWQNHFDLVPFLVESIILQISKGL
jgi:hypothetical protein